jgi:hypothetical protein
MKKKQLYFLLSAVLTVFLIGCNDEEETETFNLTQSSLDGVTNFIKSYTGGTFAHGGPDGVSADSTIREIYASIPDLTGSIPVGTIVTKNTYKKNADGSKSDQIYVSFAMVKQEAGYYTDGGDWEYIKIAYDGTVDYNTHPFGVLPAEGSSSRGQLSSCMGCHASASGSDFLFVND